MSRPGSRYEVPVTDETLPWPQPKGEYSHYLDDGPAESVTFTLCGATMKVTPTSGLGRDTLRTRFKVECLTCAEIIHSATTGSTERVLDHVWNHHGWNGEHAVKE